MMDDVPATTTDGDPLVPVAILRLNGEGSEMLIVIATHEDWRSVYDEMSVELWTNDRFVAPEDHAAAWALTFKVLRQSEIDAMPEHGGW